MHSVCATERHSEGVRGHSENKIGTMEPPPKRSKLEPQFEEKEISALRTVEEEQREVQEFFPEKKRRAE